MESQYYTPEFYEFHEGFEYEDAFLHPFFSKKRFYYQYTSRNILLKALDNKKIRVKYLDREDIESFGFVLKGKSIDLWFEKEDILLREDGHHLTNIKLQYGLKDHKLKITLVYIGGEESVCFEGYIKNKNQLLTLLISQLRIINK
jgi:hypothetical protein